MRILLAAACLFLLTPTARAAGVWVATHTLLRGERVTAGDVAVRTVPRAAFDALPASQSVTGLQARHRIATGEILRHADVGPPLLVHANDPVRVIWRATGISMELNGRALQAAAAGDPLQVLNPMTARTISGIVQPDGSVLVGGTP